MNEAIRRVSPEKNLTFWTLKNFRGGEKNFKVPSGIEPSAIFGRSPGNPFSRRFGFGRVGKRCLSEGVVGKFWSDLGSYKPSFARDQSGNDPSLGGEVS